MKRSVINKNIQWAMDACKRLHFNLPGFAFWTPEEWEKRKGETEHMVSVAQGWDVTDYNSGDFDKIGAVLFTLRNGNLYDNTKGTPYCEKIIAMKAGQNLPMHFHYTKTEDIIPISDEALELIGYSPEKKGLVFKGLKRSWTQQTMKEWIRSAGITKNITFHSYRRTYATLQAAAGTDIRTIQSNMAHKSITTTQRYMKVVDSNKREATTKITLTRKG